ncbi:diacylglycerol/polyprenol kinase family protein [Leptolyngbya sp. AN02str]|uniref:diacylglycerol/polyprenol kinase family protein n=1 Tax=Leptolyngbya sp. AN02str TaxID=3423363 RepID=UPI003D31DEF3
MLLELLSPLNPAPAVWLQLVVAGVWVVGVIAIAEGLNLVGKAEPEVVRKIVHIGIGNVILLAWWLQLPTWMGVAASLLFSVVTYLSYSFPILPGVNSVGRKSLGTFFYALSFACLIGIFWPLAPQFALLGILIMAWGDGLAALIGQRFGRHPYQIWGDRKSLEGSATMLLVSFAISVLTLPTLPGGLLQPLLIAAIVAIAATLLESFSKYGVDNLSVPLGSAAIAYGLVQIF